MDPFTYLTTPTGIELTHAVILLISATAAWISYRAKRTSDANGRVLRAHVNGQKETPPDRA